MVIPWYDYTTYTTSIRSSNRREKICAAEYLRGSKSLSIEPPPRRVRSLLGNRKNVHSRKGEFMTTKYFSLVMRGAKSLLTFKVNTKSKILKWRKLATNVVPLRENKTDHFDVNLIKQNHGKTFRRKKGKNGATTSNRR